MNFNIKCLNFCVQKILAETLFTTLTSEGRKKCIIFITIFITLLVKELLISWQRSPYRPLQSNFYCGTFWMNDGAALIEAHLM